MNQPISLEAVSTPAHDARCPNCTLPLGQHPLTGFGRGRKILFLWNSPLVETSVYFNEIRKVKNHARLFQDLLSATGITEEDYFFTSLTGCSHWNPNCDRFGDFYSPKAETIQFMKPRLKACIDQLRPEVIVPLTNEALRLFFGPKGGTVKTRRGIEEWSLDIFEDFGFSPDILPDGFSCKIIPMLSIMEMLDKPSLEHIITLDLFRIKDSAKRPGKTPRSRGSYTIVDSLEKFDAHIELLLGSSEFVLDIETTGLSFMTDKILGIAFSVSEGSGFFIPLTRYDAVPEEYTETKLQKIRKKLSGKWVQVGEKAVKKIKTRIVDTYSDFWKEHQGYIFERLNKVLSSDIPKIAHNGKFDFKFLKRAGFQISNLSFDTMLAHYLIDETLEGYHGLKDCSVLYTDLGDYDRWLDNWFVKRKISGEKRNYAHLPTIGSEDPLSPDYHQGLYYYACMDTDCTLRLKNIFQRQLEKERLVEFFDRLIMPLSNLLMDIEYRGIQIDIKYVDQLKGDLSKELDGILTEFRALVGNVDPNSPKQLVDLLFTTLGFPILERTEKGNPSTDEDVLKALLASIPKDHPHVRVLQLLLDHRRISKLIDTYINGMLELLDENKRIHTEFLITGTVTGRLSSRYPNLQNIPRDDTRIKNLFIPEPGHVFVEADFGQIEFRFWAVYSMDPQMLTDLRSGLDIHRFIASKVFNISIEQVSRSQRQLTKNVVYGLMYGMRLAKLCRQTGCTETEGKAIIEIFFSRYPIAKCWLDEALIKAKTDGQFRSVFGRIKRLPGINNPQNWTRADVERLAINAPIQGAASDMNCNAANRITRYFKEHHMDGKLMILVHDSLLVSVPEENWVEYAKVIKGEMERPCAGVAAPMIVDMSVGRRWGSMAKIKNFEEVPVL